MHGYYLKMRSIITSFAIRILKPFYKISWLRKIYWEVYASEIDRAWGHERDDFNVISALLDRCKPSTLLDLGCGSGRLFSDYIAHNIPTILGVDISDTALSIAKQRFPQVPTSCQSIEDSKFKPGQFDLVICNRTLQHIPPDKIAGVIRRICGCTERVYINESTVSEGQKSDDGLFIHDYPVLFEKEQFHLEQTGEIPKKTGKNQYFMIFKKNGKEKNSFGEM